MEVNDVFVSPQPFNNEGKCLTTLMMLGQLRSMFVSIHISTMTGMVVELLVDKLKSNFSFIIILLDLDTVELHYNGLINMAWGHALGYAKVIHHALSPNFSTETLQLSSCIIKKLGVTWG